MQNIIRSGIARTKAVPWRRAGGLLGSAFSSAATHAPENAAYGLMALAPLGAAFGPTGMALALLGAAVASCTASIFGGGRLVGDAGAALALLTAGLVQALLALMPGVDPAQAWQVLILVAVGIVGAGVLTALFGLLRLGAVVKFTPYPVRVGLSSGVGMLLMVSSLPTWMGQSFGGGWSLHLPGMAGAAAVGLCALGVTAVARRSGTRVPPVLLGLLSATTLHVGLSGAGWGASLSAAVGVPALPEAWFGGQLLSGDWLQTLRQGPVLVLLAGFAATAAIVITLDALLAASVIDGRVRGARDANRELMAQGLSNVVSALVGGLPASPALPASIGLSQARPSERHVVLAYAAALLTLLLALPWLLGALPLSAVGGVLIYLGATMVSPTLWHTPWELWRHRRKLDAEPVADALHRHHLSANWSVTLLVALAAVLLGIGPAVLLGATFAILLFVRSHMRDVVRRSWRGDTRHSLKTRTAAMGEWLRREGHRIVLLELEGALFFGTADDLRRRLHEMPLSVDTVILDMHQISEVDLTAARILFEIAEDMTRTGRHLVFAELTRGDPRRALLLSVAGAQAEQVLRFEDSADLALENAEDRLLTHMDDEQVSARTRSLSETLIARGLNAEQLTLLAEVGAQVQFAAGETLFMAGDPGDSLYIMLAGEVGVLAPGTGRRLASFGPGVTVGDMAVLTHSTRSATVVAESDVTALRVSVDAFEQMLHDHPLVAARLLGNIALHLAERLRAMNTDLAHWMSRSGKVGGDA